MSDAFTDAARQPAPSCLCQGVCPVYQEGFKLSHRTCPLIACQYDTRSRPHPAPEPFATKMTTGDSHVCYPNCVKFETKRCPYPGTSVRRDTCNCFRSNEDDHYIQSLIFGVYNYPKEIERVVKEHDAAITRTATLKARKDMAQELLDWIEKEYNFPIEYDDWLLTQIYNHLESLRQQGQHP